MPDNVIEAILVINSMTIIMILGRISNLNPVISLLWLGLILSPWIYWMVM